MEVCLVIILMSVDIFSKLHCFAPKLTVFAGHHLILAGGEMGVFSFSWKLCLAVRSIRTLNDHLGTVINMIFSDILILTSLLAVGTAVLTIWTLLFEMLLEVFTKELCRFIKHTIIRAAQLDIATGVAVIVHIS